MLIRLLLAFPFCIVAIYAVYSGFKYTRMISNIFLGLIYTSPSSQTADKVQGEKITILDSADKEIDALLVEHKGAGSVVIFCHESGAGKESWSKYAYFFPSLRFHVLSTDFGPDEPETHEENSLTQWPCEDDVERLLTVIRWAKKAFRPGTPIVLFGISKGANVAFAASFRDAAVSAVIADGLFSMKEIFRDYIKKWAPILVRPNLFGESYPRWVIHIFTELGFWYCQKKSRKSFLDVEKMLRQRHAPLLMIHGERDDYIPVTHQRFLGELGDDQSLTRLVVAGAGHNEAVTTSREVYEKEITEFISRMKRV